MGYLMPKYRLIGQVGWVFANGPGDLGSIPGRVIPKTFKMVLDTSLLNSQQYKVRIKDKVEQSRERRSALPTSRCSSYWKGSLRVAVDYGRQLYFNAEIQFILLRFNLVCFSNGISIAYESLNAESSLICKRLVYLFNGITTSFGLFNAEICLIAY